MAGWFVDAAELDLRPGGVGVLHSNAHGSRPLAVVEVRPPDLFSFRWQHSAEESATAANSLIVEITLEELAGGRTLVRVVEAGFESITRDASETPGRVARHRDGWARHLADLQACCAA
jgi:uncharacterized protein YndB with AHSA1/START domain